MGYKCRDSCACWDDVDWGEVLTYLRTLTNRSPGQHVLRPDNRSSHCRSRGCCNRGHIIGTVHRSASWVPTRSAKTRLQVEELGVVNCTSGDCGTFRSELSTTHHCAPVSVLWLHAHTTSYRTIIPRPTSDRQKRSTSSPWNSRLPEMLSPGRKVAPRNGSPTRPSSSNHQGCTTVTGGYSRRGMKMTTRYRSSGISLVTSVLGIKASSAAPPPPPDPRSQHPPQTLLLGSQRQPLERIQSHRMTSRLGSCQGP